MLIGGGCGNSPGNQENDMKREVAEQWVKALRSGKYEQGRGTLKLEKKYCCLGVLCEISGLITQNNWGATLPVSVMKWSGIGTKVGTLPQEYFNFKNLILLNDEDKAPFNQIADIIEKHWEKL